MPSLLALIVNDDARIRTGQAAWLHGVARFEVIEAATGGEAIALALARPPQLIVIDVALPDMSGLAAIRALRDAHPVVPIVIVTPHDLQDCRNKAAAAGASAYLLKHDVPRALFALLRELFPKRKLETRLSARDV